MSLLNLLAETTGIYIMPVAPSTYWNCVHGREAGDAAFDAEGLQTMRSLARNMSFLMKSIALGREKFVIPEKNHGSLHIS